jgi:hypothetical protein
MMFTWHAQLKTWLRLDEDGSVALELERVYKQVVIPAAYLVDFSVT